MSSIRRSSSSLPDTRSARSRLIAELTPPPLTPPPLTPAPLTTVAENYLKTIYSHTEWQPDPLTSSQLAARLGLAPSSITEMVRKLSHQGLVEHARYGTIVLTPAGRAAALRMVRRHRLIETWLVREFGYGWDEVHDEAEVLEHALSDRLLDAIDVRLGHPTADPHGDPIPAADGTVPQLSGTLASQLGPGATARIVRISDRDPEVLRRLGQEGIGVGSAIVGGQLADDLAGHVWVTDSTRR
jgi:DtxR family Mn-dependent transcriptional regulator